MAERRLLQVGDVIELSVGHVVYADIACHFVYANREGVFTPVHERVEIKERFGMRGGLDTRYLAGRYAVVRTSVRGGGRTGHNPGDIFPSGYRVFCQRLGKRESNQPPVCVDFYQTGEFTAMIRDIDPVGSVDMVPAEGAE